MIMHRINPVVGYASIEVVAISMEQRKYTLKSNNHV